MRLSDERTAYILDLREPAQNGGGGLRPRGGAPRG